MPVRHHKVGQGDVGEVCHVIDGFGVDVSKIDHKGNDHNGNQTCRYRFGEFGKVLHGQHGCCDDDVHHIVFTQTCLNDLDP